MIFFQWIWITLSLIRSYAFKGCTWRPVPAHPRPADWHKDGIVDCVRLRAYDWYAELYIRSSTKVSSGSITPRYHFFVLKFFIESSYHHLCSTFSSSRSLCSASKMFVINFSHFKDTKTLLLMTIFCLKIVFLSFFSYESVHGKLATTFTNTTCPISSRNGKFQVRSISPYFYA